MPWPFQKQKIQRKWWSRSFNSPALLSVLLRPRRLSKLVKWFFVQHRHAFHESFRIFKFGGLATTTSLSFSSWWSFSSSVSQSSSSSPPLFLVLLSKKTFRSSSKLQPAACWARCRPVCRIIIPLKSGRIAHYHPGSGVLVWGQPGIGG